MNDVVCNVSKVNKNGDGIIILSSMNIDDTAEFIGCNKSKIKEDTITKVNYKGEEAFVAVCSPLSRFFAYSVIPSCKEVHIIYKPQSTLSRLRARRWIRPSSKT